MQFEFHASDWLNCTEGNCFGKFGLLQVIISRRAQSIKIDHQKAIDIINIIDCLNKSMKINTQNSNLCNCYQLLSITLSIVIDCNCQVLNEVREQMLR